MNLTNEILTVIENKPLAKDTYSLTFSGDFSYLRPGQFVNLSVPGFFLRRPFGIADADENRLTVIYKVVGQGTKAMAELKNGDKIDALLGLGNGFSIEKSKKPLLIGGGTGIAPLYFLAKTFKKAGIPPDVILGFKSGCEAYYMEEFSALGKTFITTDDGSLFKKGNALSCITECGQFDYYYACGPVPMLKALQKKDTNGEFSLEGRMGCGFGACMGCTVKTTKGFKRVCREGPVFPASEAIFQ
jgi:2-polyprenylphenol hydroxylase and related flavodoxin oxidoreductases